MRNSLLPVLLCSLLGACDREPAAPGPRGIVVTIAVDSTPELSGPDVSFTVENRTSAPIYLARCGERIMVAVDRKEGERWEEHRSDFCHALLPMVPQRVAPEERVEGRTAVQIPGRYRLRFGVAASPGEARAWTTASPEFAVTP